MTNLKPCPFPACGGKAAYNADGFHCDDVHWIYCEKCGASGPVVAQCDYAKHKTHSQLAALAARKWNRRVTK